MLYKWVTEVKENAGKIYTRLLESLWEAGILHFSGTTAILIMFS